MKYNVLDLFCGAGGLSCGFRSAGFNIYGGVDFDKAALNTHKENFDTNFEICGDISQITNDVIKEKLVGNIDLIIGGPPCQGFSAANRQGNEKDDMRNKLFYEYLRFVELIKPKVFLIENVKEILTKDNGYAKNRILEITSKLGYTVNYKILVASDYGVPQNRRRAFFVGIRNDLNSKFDFEKMVKVKEKVTVYDAIGDIQYPSKKIENDFLMYAKDSKELFNHDISSHSKSVVERIKHVPQGGNWKNVPEDLWDTKRENRHSSAYRRLDFKEPSITIDTGHMNYFHPVENRTPTVRESARLQSFPDSFRFYGNRSEQLRQVGNAVPPLLGKALATKILKYLEEFDNENN